MSGEGEKRKVGSREALLFTKDLTAAWKGKYQVWPFRFGADIATTMSSISSAYIMYYFRKELKLRSYARVTCYFPVVGFSALFADAIHEQFITADIIAGDRCPLCLQTKAALLQVSAGVLYPLLLAPTMGFYMADRLLTYPVPSITRAPIEIFRLWWKLIAKNPRPFISSVIIQALGAMYITREKQTFFWNYVNNPSSL